MSSMLEEPTKMYIHNLLDQMSKAAQIASLEPASSLAPVNVKSKEEIEQKSWEIVRDSKDINAVTEWPKQYPIGRYATLEQARANLMEEAARVAVQVPKTGETCPDCPEMVVIQAGSFDMGGNMFDSEKPVHRVIISRPFAMGRTEVTQGQWRAVMGNNPSHFSSCGDNCPVENVSWNDVQKYIQKLNSNSGKHYRLPSEAEWEYACRAGGQHKYSGSDDIDTVAWYGSNSGDSTHSSGTQQANAWGLCDMSGNVWEWVEDSWHENYNGAPTDGSVWQGDGARRVLRGGSWFDIPQFVRAANRFRYGPLKHGDNIGFRLAMTLP